MALIDSFCLHVDSKPISAQELELIPTPPPMGTRHFPIPHSDFQNLIRVNAERQGYTVIDEVHAVSEDHQRYFGAFEVEAPYFIGSLEGKGLGVVIGFRHSNDQSMPAGLLVGSRVFICDNQAFSGDIVIRHKHTPGIVKRLPELVAGAFLRIPDKLNQMVYRYDAYKQHEMDQYEVDHFLMEGWRRKVFHSQNVLEVSKNFLEPPHDWGHDSAWKLFNAATYTLKPEGFNKLAQLPQTTMQIHDMLDEFCHKELEDNRGIEDMLWVH